MTRFSLTGYLCRHPFNAFVFCLIAAAVVVGCDTVAEISFTQRDFRGAVTDGVVNAASCAADSNDVELLLHFTPFDGDGIVIAPGEVIAGQLVELGSGPDQFGDDDIEFVNSVLYPAVNIPCTTEDQCDAPFTSCEPLNPANPSGSASACGLPTTIETLQRGLIYNEGARNKYLGVVMDHNQTLAGIDSDGNFDPSRATDPRDQRIAAARLFTLSYGNSQFGPDSEACVTSFGGEDIGGVHFDPTPDQCMTDDFAAVNNRLASLSVGEQGRRPVWAALEELITVQLADRDGDRIAVLFTDGRDQSSVTADYNSVLAAATASNATAHIVQLDNNPDGVPASGPVDEYTRLACATGGSYQYAGSPNDLRNYYEVLSNTVPSWYEVQAQLIALGDPSLNLDNGCYRVSTGIRITIAGQQVTIQVAGDKTDPATLQVIDDRFVVCKRPVPAPSSDGGGDGGGGSQE